MTSIRAIWSVVLTWLRYPVLGKLIEYRAFCRALVLVGILQLTLQWCGLPSITCSFRDVTGYPCPGCGLTRGVCALVQGDWDRAIQFHAFSPVAAIAMLFLLTGCVVPDGVQRRLVRIVSEVERKTCVSQLTMLLLWVYWVSRVCRPWIA